MIFHVIPSLKGRKMSVLHMFRKDPNFFEGVLFCSLAMATAMTKWYPAGGFLFSAFVSFVCMFFLALACGNVFWPEKDGRVFIPLYNWWQKNATVYEVREHAGRKYYSLCVDPTCHSLFDENGRQIGWQMTTKEKVAYLVPWEDLRKKAEPPRMHWLARMRSPSIA